ncbi:MAG: hypothetical protein IJE46_06670 [Clostridia bacterium]|nr:hypothetical protein [Clostridia bacterium]
MIFSKTSGVNDSFFGKSQEPIRLMMEKDIEAFENESALPKIFKEIKSKNFAEKFTSKTSLKNFEAVAEGGSYPKTDMQEGFSKVVEPVTWKQSFTVTREMVEDNKILDIKNNALGFTQSFGRTKEMFGAALLMGAVSGTKANFGGQSFDVNSADGVSLFSKAHPSVTDKKVLQSNLFADGFSVDALSALECKMNDFKDDNGYVLSVAPDTIIIPNTYELKRDVFAAIGADKDPNTANNGFNYQFGRWNVIVWNQLNKMVTSDNPSPFILLDSKYNERAGGAVWVDRVELEVKSYIDENNDNNIFKGRARFTAGFNNWRAFAISGIKGGDTLISA